MSKINLKSILKKTFNKKKVKRISKKKPKKIIKKIIKKNTKSKRTKNIKAAPKKVVKNNVNKLEAKPEGLRIPKNNEVKPEIKKVKKQETEKREYKIKDYIVYPKHGVGQISEFKKRHHDAWELGSGKNYSINELASFFIERFGCEVNYIEDQQGNYRETLREHDDALEELGWQPKDRLKDYIMNL